MIFTGQSLVPIFFHPFHHNPLYPFAAYILLRQSLFKSGALSVIRASLSVIFVTLIFSSFFSLAVAQDTAQDDAEIDAEVQAMSDAALALIQLDSFVDANVTFCTQHAPEAGVSEAAAAWYSSSGLTILELIKQLPEVGAVFGEMQNSFAGAALQDLTAKATGREAEWCKSVPALLQSPDWDVLTNYPDEFRTLREFYALLSGEDPPPPPLPKARALPPITSPSYAEVIAAGVNPEETFIQDEFHCYNARGTDYSSSSLVVQFSAPGQYLSSYGGGTYTLSTDTYSPEITWLSGPFKEADGELDFSNFGQSFSLGSVTLGDASYSFGCYQQGSSERAALTTFRLKTPQAGTYTCRDAETGEAQALELASGGQYSVGGASGTYSVSGMTSDYNSSQIDWLTGPFAEQSSSYTEEPDNGFRSFDLSLSSGKGYPGFVYSSSELSLSCESLGEPVSFETYGEGAAPPAPPTEKALDGLFYRYDFVSQGTFSTSEPHFYRFFPNGYVFDGAPEGDPADIDCTRTKPNGAPFCDTYAVSNGLIRIGNADPEPFSLDGAVPVISGEALTPVAANTVTRLDGLFWANAGSSFGFCGPFSMCSSSYSEWNYDFKPDNTFSYASSSQSLSSMSSPLGDTYTSAYGNSDDAGTYTIQGNVIEFRFGNGKVERDFITVSGPDSFIMGDRNFTRKTE